MNQLEADGSPEGRQKTTTEVYADILEKVRMIRNRRRISIADAIDAYGGPGIEREYRKVVREMYEEIHPEEIGENGAG